MASIAQFYVYALARPVKVKRSVTYRVFYIGKGKDQRVFCHESEARSGHKCHKCNVIRKVWREGGQIQRYILLTTDNEQEALAYEKEMIAFHGRENLCNHTDGGEGVSNPSPETIAKRVASQKRTFATPEAKAKRSAISKSMKRTSEWRARQSAALKGKRNSPEAIEKMRQKLTGRKMRPDLVEKQRQRMMGNAYGVGKGKKGRVVPEEERRRISETLKTKAPWKDKNHTPESIQKMRLSKGWVYHVTFPDGRQVTVPHMKTFCEEQGLNYSSLMNASKKGRVYQGYLAVAIVRKAKVAKYRKRRKTEDKSP